MELQEISLKIAPVLQRNLSSSDYEWLNATCDNLAEEHAARKLYLTYSLIGSRIPTERADFSGFDGSEATQYLQEHKASLRELSRIYLLTRVLEEAPSFYISKVAKLIELADTSEMITFLRYLVLLPSAEEFKNAAVEALRTNIADVFDAIALDNPYPALYFNEQQWNQMYLKAAFMQRDLHRIQAIDDRSNASLARIISDYAHERWAASRDVDPYFWRPVSQFLDASLLRDMRRMLESEDLQENRAAALVLSASQEQEALELLNEYPELKADVEDKKIRWDTLKE